MADILPVSNSLSGTTLSRSSSDASARREAQDLDVVPPTGRTSPRTLVLCFDGTGDQFDSDNSNVVLLFSMLMKDRPEEQLVYYQAGIGTYTIPQIATPLYAGFSQTMDEMFAWNLDAHVMGGYDFLMTNYQAGDKICLFGFSRGAYTARALAGMIHKVGLLPKSNHQQVPFAYHMFSRTDEVGWKQSRAFKRAFSMDVDIDFIGVWDTVCSVGLIPHVLPFTASNNAIRIFRHALSLDEHRAKFKANHYNFPTAEEHKLGVQPGEMPKSVAPKKAKTKDKNKADIQERSEEDQEFEPQELAPVETDVLEVWFAGCHCDVGGGSVSNESTHNLARIPLRWMIRECFKTNTGIRFHADLLRKVGIDPTNLYPYVKPRPAALYHWPTEHTAEHTRADSNVTLNGDALAPGTEEQEDLTDALCDIYDQLVIAKWWWLLEYIPLAHRRQVAGRKWVDATTINRGRGRIIPDHSPFNVHRSVNIRLEAQKLKGGPYKPNVVDFEKHRARIHWVE